MKAFISGADTPLGMAYAQHLARLGHDLILIVETFEAMFGFASDLQHDHDGIVELVEADVTQPEDLARVAARLGEVSPLTLLVNCTALSTLLAAQNGSYLKTLKLAQEQIQATIQLCNIAADHMQAQPSGAIINVSSLSSFLPNSRAQDGPGADLNAFSTALQERLSHTPIRVQALCPGHVDTLPRHDIPEYLRMSVHEVVEQSLEALSEAHHDVIFVPGLANRALLLLANVPGLRGRLKSIL